MSTVRPSTILSVQSVGRGVHSGSRTHRLAVARSAARSRTSGTSPVSHPFPSCVQFEDIACRRRAHHIAGKRLSLRGPGQSRRHDHRRCSRGSDQEHRLARPICGLRRARFSGHAPFGPTSFDDIAFANVRVTQPIAFHEANPPYRLRRFAEVDAFCS